MAAAVAVQPLGSQGIVSNIVIAIIILLACFVIGKLVGKILQKLLHDIEVDSFLRKTLKVKFSVEDFFSAIATYAIYLIGFVSALRRIGIATNVLNMVLVLAVSFILISLFIGIRNFIPNAIAGFRIGKKGLINEGDFIRVKNTEGRIIKINITEVVVETRGHDMIHIANSTLAKNEIVKLKKKSR